MGFLNGNADGTSVAQAINRSDGYFYFTGDVEDNDPNASALGLGDIPLQGIVVASDSDMDKFSVTFRDVDGTTLISQMFGPGAPWVNRAPILTPYSLDIANARPYQQAVLTGGQRPTGKLLLLLRPPGGEDLGLRPPKFVNGAIVTGGAESVVARIYCYGRRYYSLMASKINSANALVLRLEGQRMSAGGLPVVEDTIATFTIPAGGGSDAVFGDLAGYDRLVLFGTGPTLVTDSMIALEVRD